MIMKVFVKFYFRQLKNQSNFCLRIKHVYKLTCLELRFNVLTQNLNKSNSGMHSVLP